MARVPVQTRLEQAGIPLVDAAAKRFQLTRAEYIRMAVAAALENDYGIRKQIAKLYPGSPLGLVDSPAVAPVASTGEYADVIPGGVHTEGPDRADVVAALRAKLTHATAAYVNAGDVQLPRQWIVDDDPFGHTGMTQQTDNDAPF